VSRLKASPKQAKNRTVKAEAPRQLPEVFFDLSALDDEFRRQLDPHASLEQVRDDYLESIDQIEEFGPETPVAEIVQKMD
jgi:hypothetical protein